MKHNPTILLAMPKTYHIYQPIIMALEYHSFKVVPAIFDDTVFQYPSLRTRLLTKFRQIILKDSSAKHRLKQAVFKQQVLQDLQCLDALDYSLFIRGDLFAADFLKTIHDRTSHPIINYQWDGMNRFPDIWENVDLFDRFYVFDPADLRHDARSFLPCTNFYFDHDLDTLPETRSEFCFVGMHCIGRQNTIINFAKLAQHKNWQLDFHIGSGGNQNLAADLCDIYPKNITVFTQNKTFAETLDIVKRSRVLVDFKIPIHNGLSFRPFEALGYRKKLITTNENVAKYDFYHPDNILIWDGETLDGIDNFLNIPYHELPSEIYEKYSFGNWIKYVLDIQPHIPIQLPTD